MIKISQKITPVFGLGLCGALIIFSLAFGFMVYFSLKFPNPTELQISTYETCKNITIAGATGLFGMIFGKLTE